LNNPILNVAGQLFAKIVNIRFCVMGKGYLKTLQLFIAGGPAQAGTESE